MKRNKFVLMILAGVIAIGGCATAVVTTVEKPDTTMSNDFYVSNRAPLQPTAFVTLPTGSITPQGWVKEFLERQRAGLTGNLGRISAWLQKDDNAWLSKDGKGKWGWEELPYWLKGYIDLAYLLQDEEMIKESHIWIEGALNSQRPDGDFGPDHRFGDGTRDYWANMIMMFCLQSYYEYTNDARVLDLMTKYFKYQLTVPDNEMLTGYWQHMRGGDNLFSIYWLYNRTGDAFLLELAEKMHRNTANWEMDGTLPNWHNVNVAQCFGEPGTYYMQSHDKKDLKAAYDNFHIIRDIYGQVPGGMFGGDENCRPGFDDPRQAVETCGLVEQMLSNELLLSITGDTFWADHCEEIAFNSYPAAVMPDFRALRYLTAPNMVISDKKNHHPGIDNSGPFLMMNPFSSRCCQHNHSHGWPYFCKSLWMASPDNGLAAVIYSACDVTAKVGDGTEVTIKERGNYPFEEQIKFSISMDKAVSFPLYLRIPGWCKAATILVNGKAVDADTTSGKFVRVERTWADGDDVTLNLPMELSMRTWVKNHDSVSIDYGPLTFSLKIGEKYVRFESDETAIGDSQWQDGVDTAAWPSHEIHPTTPWNYGLVLDKDNPLKGLKVTRKAWPANNFPFTLDAVPLSLTAKAKKIPEWTLDMTGLCSVLQDSPVKSDQPTETVELVPMGAARLRISAFPVIGTGPDAVQWEKPQVPTPAPYIVSASHTNDTIEAMCDGLKPLHSNDHSIPRFTWWNHKGSQEWVAYDFKKPMTVDGVSVYWFDDTGRGECRVPKSWTLLYKVGEKWMEVQDASDFTVTKDGWDKVSFKPVTAEGLKIVVQLQRDFSGGVLEWTVSEKK